MRIDTVTTEVYTFNELSEDAQNNAIESMRSSYYEYNHFAEWAADGCHVLNPPYKELQKYGLKDDILIENKGQIYFDTGRSWFIDCAESMNVVDDDILMQWLGIPKELTDKFTYNIYTPIGRDRRT